MLTPLKWLTLLSLDAPLVAIAWQALISRQLSTGQSWHRITIVFLSVWLGYSADRWFDNRKRVRPLSEQHRFLARHEKAVPIIWILTLCFAVALASTSLSPSEFTRGFCLMLASLAYTLFAQKGRSLATYPLLKSLFTALLILSSSILFIPRFESLPLAFLASTWLLFSANCLFIRAWTRPAETRSASLALSLSLASLSIAVFVFWKQDTLLAASIMLALAGLALTHAFRHRIAKPLGRTLADLCLLSPFILILF